ncbi:hypothetical protein Niako_4758 [Niastella koreensis GR20-10]|uniref:Uncharacterized protein n=1 Tax=Niastella koreensis (strain DSM 17620 / KACC 11465 / NBRC 106392 / GR20-10) TaxID=700598 RepID=G8TQ10_NIAKG|nr:hypothetical protein Niako_4758 [Niastella koreensis GR20-10]
MEKCREANAKKMNSNEVIRWVLGRVHQAPKLMKSNAIADKSNYF